MVYYLPVSFEIGEGREPVPRKKLHNILLINLYFLINW